MQPCDHPRVPTSVLLVDDQVANVGALEAALAPLGHRLVRATSCEQTLALLSREEFALVVIEVRMPALEGIETAAAIRSRPRTRKLPILFLTAAELDGEVVAKAYGQGGVDFIVEPFDPRVLRSKVASCVDWYSHSEEHKRELAAVRRRDRQRFEEQTANRVRNLTDVMPLCVWAANRDGRITYTNKAWTDYTGLGADDANERAHLEVIHPDDRDSVTEAWRVGVQEGRELVVQYRIRRKVDGSYRWHLGRAIPERGPRGAIVGWIATATDIDDQKHAEARMTELAARTETARAEAEAARIEAEAARIEAEVARAEAEAARVDAEAASRMKDEFLATLSHELRTPLNAIYGWTRMMRSGELDERRSRKAVETIERNTRVQIKLVEDLLDVSRIVAGKLRLDLKTLSPADIVRTAVEMMMPVACAKNVQLVAVYDTSRCRVMADPSRIQQVVWNLLSNAIKFTPAGGRIDVFVGTVDGCAEIAVTDSGQGIAPEFVPHVFDAFRQADGSSTRAHGGLGLGLAIVKHLVELHQGSVEVDGGGEGRGARFLVRLPTRDPDRECGSEWTSPPSGSFAELPHLTGVRVLVVDDDEDSRDMLTMVLEQYGATVTRAACAAEAWASIAASRPDVLLSDIGMPGENGYALVRRIRAAEEESGVFLPAIALTGYATTEDGQRALDAGFQLHMAKPIEPSELLMLIARLLKQAVPSVAPAEQSGRFVSGNDPDSSHRASHRTL